jgi:exopolysaccharide biosynthesis polyprenyl glycosylphosphotransferase
MAVEAPYADTLPLARPKDAPVRFGRGWAITLFVADLLTLIAATVAATHVAQNQLHAGLAVERVALAQAVCTTAWLLVFYRVGLYQRSFALSVRDEIYCTVTALIVGALPLLILFTIWPAISTSRAVLLLSLVFGMVAMGVERSVARLVYGAAMQGRSKRIAIVGTKARIERALEQMLVSPRATVHTIEIEDVESTLADIDSLAGRAIDSVPWLRQVRDAGCDLLVVTEVLPPRVLPPLLQTATLERFKVAFAPPRICSQAYGMRLETDGHQALIVMQQLHTFTHGSRILKRTFDIVAAGAILVLAAPIMIVAAIAIALEDGGPVLYRQERVGLFGRRFEILKLRSMRVDAERESGPMWSPPNDDRTTRVGRFVRRTSIDELPQLFNVLRGEMSVVGPRPERPMFVERFRRELPRYDERHLVRPGITGWSHVNMPRKLDPAAAAERLSHDLWYIEHWGLFMDVSIVFKTGAEFLFQRQ